MWMPKCPLHITCKYFFNQTKIVHFRVKHRFLNVIAKVADVIVGMVLLAGVIAKWLMLLPLFVIVLADVVAKVADRMSTICVI